MYPSHEEAEYTAPLAFSIAVAASWWAGRMGIARLHVPRMPAIQCTGRREHWLQMDASCMRVHAMAPLAITLGLTPADPIEAARVPKRARVAEVLQQDGTLPPNPSLRRTWSPFPPTGSYKVGFSLDAWA